MKQRHSTYVIRGCGIIRDRCETFIEKLRANGYTNALPLNKATELFQDLLGIYDQKSLAAYFGTQEHDATQRIRRYARYQSGTQSIKDIELKQHVPKRTGYLERLNLVSYELRGKLWFLVLKPKSIVPELVKTTVQETAISNQEFRNVPVVESSMKNISLPLKDNNPIPKAVHEACMATALQVPPSCKDIVERSEERESIGGERNQWKLTKPSVEDTPLQNSDVMSATELTVEESAILSTKPCDIDIAKRKCPKATYDRQPVSIEVEPDE